MDGSFRSRPDQTSLPSLFSTASRLTIVTSRNKTYRSISLPIIAHSSRINHGFSIPRGLLGQKLPGFCTVQSTYNDVKLSKEKICILIVVEIVTNCSYLKIRHYFIELFLDD